MNARRMSSYVLVALSILPILFPQLLSSFSVYQSRMLAILLLAVVLWMSEIVPVYATGLLIISLELVLLSNKGLSLLVGTDAPLDYRQVMANFASPIVILFLGGFALATAANKYKIDRSMAKVLLKPFGQKPASIVFGLMSITALFSMFMSNTATTAMMLAILTPLLTALPDEDPAKKGFLLAIPLAANIGGMGTPIGTPPNAVAMKYLTGAQAVSFGQWMLFGLPIVIILLLIAWWWLMTAYKPKLKTVDLAIKTVAAPKRVSGIFFTTFGLTVVLWLSGAFHGMNTYVVSMLPLTVFFLTGILDKSDIKKFNWEVLWLIAGGIALGEGMFQSGLSEALIALIPTDALSVAMVIVIFSVVAYVMANLVSHTATANLVLPLVATVASGFSDASALKPAIIIIALTCSLGMGLPISTPPNALAYSTGQIQTKDLLLTGGVVSAIGLLLLYGLMMIF